MRIPDFFLWISIECIMYQIQTIFKFWNSKTKHDFADIVEIGHHAPTRTEFFSHGKMLR